MKKVYICHVILRVKVKNRKRRFRETLIIKQTVKVKKLKSYA